MDNKKIKIVKVITPAGERRLTYEYGEISANSPEPVMICETECPYYRCCRLFPNPEDPNDFKNSRFANFCVRLADRIEEGEDYRDIRNYHPQAGTIENELGDIFPRILEVIQEENPIVRVSDVIDSVCKFQCDMWDEKHSQCGEGNAMCLLSDLFEKGRRIVPKNSPVFQLDTKRDISGKKEKL